MPLLRRTHRQYAIIQGLCSCMGANHKAPLYRKTPKLMDAYDGAYRKGVQAFKDGKSEHDCPYNDTRNYRGMITFSRAFIRAWLTGFRAAKAGEAKETWTSKDPHY